MPRKRHKPEEIVAKLRQAAVLRLEPAELLAPAVVGHLRDPNRAYRVGKSEKKSSAGRRSSW